MPAARRTTRPSAVTAALAVALLAAPGGPIDTACASPAYWSRARSPVDDSWTTLTDPALPDDARLGAAKLLIAQSGPEGVEAKIAEEISRPLANGATGVVLIRAIAQSSNPRGGLFEIVAGRLKSATPEEAPRLLEALGSFRTLKSAGAVFEFTSPDRPPGVSTAAFGALARLSGRDDLGNDREAWRSWLSGLEASPESAWRDEIAANHAARADRASERARDLSGKLVDSLRQLHLRTPAEGRSALLAKWLKDAQPEVRGLGFELVGRELSASGGLGPEVGEAALSLLESPDASTRASAARVIRQLAPGEANAAVLRALNAEQDPAAAGALLLAAARWPDRTIAPAMLRWLESDSSARQQAAETAWQVYRSAELNSEAQLRVLGVLRTFTDEELSPASASLLAALGDADDRERLAPLLRSSSASLRNAVAEALLWDPEYTLAILNAASTDPDLFDPASRALLVGAPSADQFRALLALPRPAPDVASKAVLRLAEGLSPPDLWEVVQEQPDPALRLALLRELTSSERQDAQSQVPEYAAAIGAGIVAYADVLLDGGQPADALALIESCPFTSGSPATEVVPGLLDTWCAARIAIGQVERAEAMERAVDVWVRGLALTLREPHAQQVVDVIERRFAESLSDEQREVINAVRTQVAPERESPSTRADPPR